jgi:hypothetical protein
MSAKVSGSGTGTVRDTAKAFGLGSPILSEKILMILKKSMLFSLSDYLLQDFL